MSSLIKSFKKFFLGIIDEFNADSSPYYHFHNYPSINHPYQMQATLGTEN